MLIDIRQRYPGVAVRLLVANPSALLQLVKSEEHEFFVGNMREVPRDGNFEGRSIGSMPGGFYVRRGHPLLDHSSLRVADLVPYGVGTGKLPTDVAMQLAKMMGLPDGAPLPVAIECDDVHLLKRVALGSDTVIVGTDDLLAEEIAGETIVQLAIEDFPPSISHSQLGIVSLSGRTPSPAAAYAMDVLERIAKERFGS